MRERCPGNPYNPENIDVKHAVPLLVIVRLDGALGADPGVVNHEVDAVQLRRDPLDGRTHGVVGGDVAFDRELTVDPSA